MINIDIITRACTNQHDITVLKTVDELLEKYGMAYVAGTCNNTDEGEIHNILKRLNESGFDIYEDTNDDMKDAELIYFNSDNIWKRK